VTSHQDLFVPLTAVSVFNIGIYLLCTSSSSGEGPFCTWGVCLGNWGPVEREEKSEL